MDRTSAIEFINKQEPSFLRKAKKGWICPECNNGAGSTGDGIVLNKKDGKHYKCFKCGLSADILELYGKANNIEDFNSQLKEAGKYYGVEIDAYRDGTGDTGVYQKQDKTEQNTHTHSSIHTNTQAEDNTAYYKECMQRVGQTDYFKKRGLSDAVISKYMLGYDPKFNKGTGGKNWKAVIIPTGSSSYVARNTENNGDDRYRKSGASQIYLKKTLTEATSPIFVVEGEMDALSIIEAGGEAVGLGSTMNYKKFIDAVTDNKPVQPIILALDNDEAGQETSKKIGEELTALDVPYCVYNPYGDSKDANEALNASRAVFTEEVSRAIAECKNIANEELRAEKEEYLKNSAYSHLKEFLNGITESVNTQYIPTGFDKLDKVLDGGLFEGLITIGAISSLGKTTLLLQIADQIAQSGQDVLFFSLEMARTELMSKSISRETLKEVLARGGDIRDAKTTRGITVGKRYANYSKNEMDIIKTAVSNYSEYANHIFIVEGIGDIGTDKIASTVKKHIELTGNRPVCVIDYLQILAPHSERATDKQNTDKSVLELKRLSRDYKIPVIAISSLNRQNYKSVIDMEAFKESGAIEYSSDVLIGLQLAGAGGKDFDLKVEKQKTPREVELVILKNRNGSIGNDPIQYMYYPQFNMLLEQ